MTAFFCDTDSELWWETAKELGITNVIRMPYTICDKEYFCDLGEDFDPKWFYGLVRKGNMPITSALNPEDYKNYFEPFFKKGEDIFYVAFGEAFSGTFKYMDIAVSELKKKYPDVEFTRYDTKAISLSVAIAIIEAAKAFNSGMPVPEIVKLLDELCPKINASIVVDDLQHLKRGGRLSSAQALIGGILKIKPIIKLTKEGKLASLGKATGTNKAHAMIIDEVISTVSGLEKYPIFVVNADCPEDGARLTARLKAALPNADIREQSVGPVIGAHCGPGTIAVCFVGAERPNA